MISIAKWALWRLRHNIGGTCPKLPQFQCRVFGDDPVAEPRGRRRRPHHRIRRQQQQRSPRSPELQRSPREANCSKTNSPTAALLRAQRVALSTSRQWIKMSAREGQRGAPKPLVFQCRLLAMTPYLAARGRRPHPSSAHQQRSPRAPELHRRPDGDGGQQPQRRPGGTSAADLAIGLLPCLPGCWAGMGGLAERRLAHVWAKKLDNASLAVSQNLRPGHLASSRR